MAECRHRSILLPPLGSLQRLCIRTKARARRETHQGLTLGLSRDQRYQLDQLTKAKDDSAATWLAWLRQYPESSKPSAMLELLERLDVLKGLNIDPAVLRNLNPVRLAQIEREGRRVTVQHIADFEPERRHATLVVTCLDLRRQITDQAIELFERLVGAMFRKAQGRHDREFIADGRAINEKLRLM